MFLEKFVIIFHIDAVFAILMNYLLFISNDFMFSSNC